MPQTSRVKDEERPDGREPGDWKTRYEPEAWRQIRAEAILLGAYFLIFRLSVTFLFFLNVDFSIPVKFIGDAAALNCTRDHLVIFFVGCVGGTIFAIKWLIHSVANALWNQDRILWRIFVPLTGGVYALVVLALFKLGMGVKSVPMPANADSESMRALALAFLAGYFADGVSGMLTNIANAIFGKVEKK